MAVFVDKLLIALGIDPRGAEQGLDRVNNGVDRTDAKLDRLKHKAGGVARSIAMQLEGPLLAAFSAGKMVQGYISSSSFLLYAPVCSATCAISEI